MYPTVAIGTLSGNLPKSATTAAGPLPGANGEPAGGPVSLDENNALQGVTMTPFKTMEINSTGAAFSFSPSQLLFLQQQFEQQSQTALANQVGGPTGSTT